MKIITIVGARPQFIKAAAVSREIANYPDIEEIIIHTGQHYDSKMSDIFFDEMAIPKPSYNLDVNGLTHGAMTGQMLEKIEKVLLDERPEWVLVYGDTNSTLAGALAASKLHIKVAHVEAGLRSFNMEMPEEINRILTDRISSVLFCPTDTAIDHLKNEGYTSFETDIVKTGDVMQDAALYYAGFSKERSRVIEKENLSGREFVLATIHRPENTDNVDKLKSIISALNTISKEQPVILPLHPRTKKIIEQHNIETSVTIIDPVGYFDMIELLKNCSLVMTDSGGLQKEAFFFGKHSITMRAQTEWVELVDNGFTLVVGSDREKILQAYHQMTKKESDFTINLYGKGRASRKIVSYLEKS